MNKNLLYILILTNILDYTFYYINNDKRECDKWGATKVFFENNPIFNNFIYQPMNTISNLFYYILLNNYKDTNFENLQIVSVDTMAFGSMFMHGSFTNYGAFIDVLGMIFFFISLILKDLKIFGKLNEAHILKYLPYLIIIIRYSGRYFISNCNDINSIKDLKLFKLLVGLKITGEIRKYSKSTNFQIYNLLWIWMSSFLFLIDEEDKVKTFLNNSKNFLKFKNILDAPWFLIFIYGYLIRKITVRKQKNKKYFIIGLVLIIISFYFQEGEFSKVTVNNEKSLFQNHTLWHILSAISLYLIDKKYLRTNIV